MSQDVVNQYSPNMVQGMLALLKNCPQEVAHLRRELLIAARHVLATDLRTYKTEYQSHQHPTTGNEQCRTQPYIRLIESQC